jgi:hypothetical protein
VTGVACNKVSTTVAQFRLEHGLNYFDFSIETVKFFRHPRAARDMSTLVHDKIKTQYTQIKFFSFRILAGN